MEPKVAIEKIREFLKNEHETGKNLITTQATSNLFNTNDDTKIKFGLDKYKEIILEEEMGLELGGINKKSFSIVIPIEEINLLHPGNIILLGNEINTIEELKMDFGIILLIGINKDNQKTIAELRQLNFLSDGIEGFSIRTIPRRFWCRISSSALQKGFSFEFLGNAIIQLYLQKFKELVKSVEVIFINSYPDSIDRFIVLSSEIFVEIRKKWKKKINEWRKRIDCEYDWGCEICPYQEECYEIKQILASREEIKN
jgi:CO dehydrogenase/acetyl-CoA synthase beta subunit